VNFVDPTGLDDDPSEPWDPNDTVVININEWLRGGGGGGGITRRLPMLGPVGEEGANTGGFFFGGFSNPDQPPTDLDKWKKYAECMARESADIAEDFNRGLKQAATTAGLILLLDGVGVTLSIGLSGGTLTVPAAIIGGVAALGTGVLFAKQFSDLKENAQVAAKRADRNCKREAGL
jgi:hypothetical protein